MDKKGFVYMWHVSPEANIYKLIPKTGQQAVKMGVPGVYLTSNLASSIAWAATYVLGKKTDKDSSGKNYEEYMVLYFYKIKVPKHIIEFAWHSKDWEDEWFIPKQYVDQLEIVSKKMFSRKQIHKMFGRIQWSPRLKNYDKETKGESVSKYIGFKKWVENVEAGLKMSIVEFLKDELKIQDDEAILDLNTLDIEPEVMSKMVERGVLSDVDDEAKNLIKNGITIRELVDILSKD